VGAVLLIFMDFLVAGEIVSAGETIGVAWALDMGANVRFGVTIHVASTCGQHIMSGFQAGHCMSYLNALNAPLPANTLSSPFAEHDGKVHCNWGGESTMGKHEEDGVTFGMGLGVEDGCSDMRCTPAR